MGHSIKQRPSLMIFLISAVAWIVVGVPHLHFNFATSELLAIGLFLCGLVIAMEELFQTNTVTGNGFFPLVISLAMILNPVSEYGLLFIVGLFFPLVFLIGKSKGGSVGRRIFATTLVFFFFMSLFLLSDVIREKERVLVFALGAIFLSFIPFVVRIYAVDQNESAWKGLILHQTMLRMSVILLSPVIIPNGDGPSLQRILFWVTIVLMGILIVNAWVRREQRVWDCSFQSLLSLLVINFASLAVPASLDWMAGATLASLVMSLVPTQRPSDSQGPFSQIMVATENGSLGGAVFLFSVGALVSVQTAANPEMAIAQTLVLVLIGFTGWVFVPRVQGGGASSNDAKATPKMVFQILCILGALAMAGYKYVDAVARRINV